MSLAVISGPTGIGKTAVALDLAERLDAEIVSADSVQVYRYLDIGSAKPSFDERARVRHHLIDVASPDEPFDAALYRSLAVEACRDIQRRGKRILVVGGTGLYIKALVKGLFEAPPNAPGLRARLKQSAATRGPDWLYGELRRVDPEAALRIHPHDTYRIVRALEVYEQTGRPISAWQKSHLFSGGSFRYILCALDTDRKELYRRIDLRVDMMMAQGFLEEVKGLLDMGYSPELRPLKTIGYCQMVRHLMGETGLEEAADSLKQETRRFAKRQLTWLRGQPEVEWFGVEDVDGLFERVRAFFRVDGRYS